MVIRAHGGVVVMAVGGDHGGVVVVWISRLYLGHFDNTINIEVRRHWALAMPDHEGLVALWDGGA